MQYILDEKDMTKLKSESFIKGLNEAVRMLNGSTSHVRNYKVGQNGNLEAEHINYNRPLEELEHKLRRLNDFERKEREAQQQRLKKV